MGLSADRDPTKSWLAILLNASVLAAFAGGIIAGCVAMTVAKDIEKTNRLEELRIDSANRLEEILLKDLQEARALRHQQTRNLHSLTSLAMAHAQELQSLSQLPLREGLPDEVFRLREEQRRQIIADYNAFQRQWDAGRFGAGFLFAADFGGHAGLKEAWTSLEQSVEEHLDCADRRAFGSAGSAGRAEPLPLHCLTSLDKVEHHMGEFLSQYDRFLSAEFIQDRLRLRRQREEIIRASPTMDGGSP